MLHKPDAAYITQAGRCYLQVGNDEVYELFQSGWSGAPYDENLEGGKSEIAKLLTTDGKTEMTGGHARAVRKQKALYNWISSLISCLEAAPVKDAEHFYQQIAARKLDYQKNEYNMKRLGRFHPYLCSGKTEKWRYAAAYHKNCSTQ